MDDYEDLPFREPTGEWRAEPLPLEVPFPETEPIPTWSWELTAGLAISLVLITWISSYAITVFTSGLVRFNYETTMAYVGLSLAAISLVAMVGLLLRKKEGLLLALLPLSFLAGTYLPSSFMMGYMIMTGELSFQVFFGAMLLEYLVPLLSIASLGLLCSPRSRAALQVSSRTLAICLLVGLGLGVCFSSFMVFG